jgi:hypothetical protein
MGSNSKLQPDLPATSDDIFVTTATNEKAKTEMKAARLNLLFGCFPPTFSWQRQQFSEAFGGILFKNHKIKLVEASGRKQYTTAA